MFFLRLLHTHIRSAPDIICHCCLMQTEKSQPECKRIMSETRFTEFPALFVDLRVGIRGSASETDV